jgi:hypothetical protein
MRAPIFARSVEVGSMIVRQIAKPVRPAAPPSWSTLLDPLMFNHRRLGGYTSREIS